MAPKINLTLIRRALCGALAALSLCLTLAVSMTGCAKKITYTLEAGSDLPSPYRLVGADGAAYVAGFDETCVNRPGTYDIPMTDAAGKRYKLKLTVRDRKAPVVTVRHVYYAKGVSTPDALDFIGSIVEADEYTAYFECDLPDMNRIGDYDIVFRVEDASGNKTKELHSILTVIEDNTPPAFLKTPELSAYVGEAIAYRKGLVVEDNCGGPVDIQVDSSSVDPNTPGDYEVRFTATDESGNTSQASTVIHVYENQVTEEQLNEKIDAVIAQIITPDMDKEAQLRAVYRYVYDHIAYTSDSDKSDWIRAAYDGLFVAGSGDCYNYFAAAIAFCRRLGIDYREIERTPGAADGTHFWIMVNIGTAEEPRWYHFDCTHLRASYSHSGCLLTDQQINAFNRFRAGFYAYDSSQYPATDKKIITRTPDLEKFY
ncbi:MAG: transglutaminase domain-containing protein [Clostridia bacterium]|nr:transglutaminase domain-containing protein [Clostridia bacterium]